MARPIATRWRCPPESWPGLRSRYSVNSRISAARLPAAFAQFRNLGELQRKLNIFRNSHMWVERIVLEDHCDVAIFGFDIVNHSLPIDSDPDVTLSKPAIIRRAVDSRTLRVQPKRETPRLKSRLTDRQSRERRCHKSYLFH